MKKLIFILTFLPLSLMAQYDPAGGEPGSLAVHRDNTSIGRWGDSVEIIRGYQQINDTSYGWASVGSSIDALGKADMTTISLGDGGQATYYFEQAVSDVDGPDFIIFENGFDWAGGYFLELAFVEVSSDGHHFVRFPAYSAADTTEQITNLAYMECQWYHNLAGKHQAPYGTPFDLNELKDSQNLDIANIHHIRLIDVVGSLIDSIAQRDYNGVKINDPWPTNFEPGGFDLDGIAVLDWPLSVENMPDLMVNVWPNPASQNSTINVNIKYTEASIQDVSGRIVYQYNGLATKQLRARLTPGIYNVKLETEIGSITKKICVY